MSLNHIHTIAANREIAATEAKETKVQAVAQEVSLLFDQPTSAQRKPNRIVMVKRRFNNLSSLWNNYSEVHHTLQYH